MEMTEENKMRKKMANTIRFLAADMVQKANSGHPGAPMGLADIAVVLGEHLKHNPKNSKWLNRDRLVFSGGHGSALIYSLLHLWGYDDVSLEDLKQFRQLDSKTPGHPEFGHTDGIEITTGPLGQGIANAVGFAMAAKYTGHQVNSETCELIDHKVYCFCGDGDLQEGISYEACSVAGHNKLDNLVLIYDSNCITIEGDTSIAWSEDVSGRFTAQGWDVKKINGHCYDDIEEVINEVKTTTKPTIIIANTIIGRGAGELEGTAATHGAPLGEKIISEAKEKEGFPAKNFHIPEDALVRFRTAIELGEMHEKQWIHLHKQAPLVEQNEAMDRLLNPDLSVIEFPDFSETAEMATRDSNGQILNAIAKAIPGFVGGSADLGPSNKTELKEMGDFPKGRNMHFGIREHSMAAITNAMALYGTIIPFNATFFVFSDYLKPAARIAALTSIQNFFVWTHDSIGVGEDGPTHEPIEHISQFRALPNFYVWRPADARENVEAWRTALKINAPHGFVLSRQKLKMLKPEIAFGSVSHGAYLVEERQGAGVTLMASGSELMLCLNAACDLEKEGIKANVVSVPCLDLFNEQDSEYKSKVIKSNTKVLAVEAATATEYYRYADDVLGMESFGASAPAPLLFEKFGFTTQNIIKKVRALV